MSSIAVVGPTKADKTVYLACLMRAAYAQNISPKQISVRPTLGSNASFTLDEIAMKILKGDAAPATSSILDYQLDVDLPGSFFWNIGEETLRLHMVDTPGGHCMPPVGDFLEPQVVASVEEADSVLLIIPADDDVRPSDLKSRLSYLIDKARGGNAEKYPFQRIAVVLTMSELLVMHRGIDALSTIEKMNAFEEIERICGSSFIKLVKESCPPGSDWYSLVSVFGFSRETGDVAVSKDSGKWKLSMKHTGFKDSWMPDRVFEPLEFLARGICWQDSYS